MARYNLTYEAITNTAFADTTGMTDNNYPFLLQGGNSTMRLNISEVFAGGESAASAPTHMKLARDSTVGVTVTAGTCRNAAADGSSVAPGTLAVFGHSAVTDPQRSSTLHLLSMAFNAFGGLFRWVARHGEEISVVGNTASLGEVSLSAFTGGGGITSGHCIYELV
jgi:hypothetical protein